MANPQVGNGHIEIANDIVSHLARTQLSGYESRIIWALWRKTWGWVAREPDGKIRRDKKGKAQKKKHEFISLEEWEVMTDIKKTHICRTLQVLKLRCIITQMGNGSYGFQKNYAKWLPPIKRSELITQMGNELPKTVTKEKAGKGKPLTTGKGESTVTQMGNDEAATKKTKIVTQMGNGVTQMGNFAEPQTTTDTGSRVAKETLLERKKRSTVPIRAQESGSLSCNPTSGQESKPGSDEDLEQVGASPAPTGGARSGLKPIGSSHPVDLPRLSTEEVSENRKKFGELGKKLRRRKACEGCIVGEICRFCGVTNPVKGQAIGIGECLIGGSWPNVIWEEVKCGDEVRKKELLAMVEKRKKSDRSVESDKSEVK